MLLMSCSSSDEKSLAVQSISVTSDDTTHVNTDSTSSLSEDSDEEIDYYDGNETLPIFKSGWKGNTLKAMAIAQHLCTDRKPLYYMYTVVYMCLFVHRNSILRTTNKGYERKRVDTSC